MANMDRMSILYLWGMREGRILKARNDDIELEGQLHFAGSK